MQLDLKVNEQKLLINDLKNQIERNAEINKDLVQKFEKTEALLKVGEKDKQMYLLECEQTKNQLKVAQQEKLKVETTLKEHFSRNETVSKDWQRKYEQLVQKTLQMQAAAAALASNHSAIIQKQER